jgi:hypothetical protein
VSERVAPRLVLLGAVVTWFVTGFPDPGKVDSLRQEELTMAGRVGEGWQHGRHESFAVSCHSPLSHRLPNQVELVESDDWR